LSAGIFLLSDFNADPLGRFLRNRLGADVTVAPYNQVYQALQAPEGGDTAILWVRPENILSAFAAALEMSTADHARCLQEVDMYADFVLSFAKQYRHCLVASWTLPPGRRGYGLLDWKPGLGLTGLLAQINLRLSERLSEADNIYMLDSARWLNATPDPVAAKMWYAAKVPYVNAVFEAAATDIDACLNAISGKSRRLVIVDLDNTMWGGVIGETGWNGIRLGGHDFIGEAFAAFQRGLKSLSNRGIQIALVSKNDEATALEAFDKHPEMALRRADLAGWRINWHDKAANITALAEELNLGLKSIVFLDDNPTERGRVREALPDVLVPEWPEDPCLYAQALLAMDCFDTAIVSAEDRQRTAMYVAERDRRESRAAVTSMTDWLTNLGVVVTVSDLTDDNTARAAQLLNKTNQLNMATRRLTEREFVDWASASGRAVMAVSVADKFGDMGLCGVVTVETKSGKAHLVDYVLSCRAMGRGVENTMFHLAVREARRAGAGKLLAQFVPTERNRPTRQVLEESGLAEGEGQLFSWDCSVTYDCPAHVELIEHAEPAVAPA
jgi:FkbH-like protein